MGDIMDGLDSEAYDRTYGDWNLVKRIAGYFAPYRRRLALLTLVLAASSVSGAAIPILISRAIDVISKRPTIVIIGLFSVAILGFGVLGWIFNYIQQRVSATMVGNVVLKLREDVFAATMEHDLSFFDENPSGKIVSRVTSDTQDFSNVVNLVTELLGEFLVVALIFVWLLTINAPLTLVLVAMAPLA
ncbi:MAG TPA: ABC transporter ATP-binding protein, partial [Spirochaetia bacterium]|nr:ABC transporter ATP-binding protein [Spirochaetia bacterium]